MNQPKFEIGDRVTYASPELPYQKQRGIGQVVWEMATHYYIKWENFPEMDCPHLKEFEDSSSLLVKVSSSSEPKTPQPSKTDSLPEISKQNFAVGDRVYQANPDHAGTITKISRGKASVRTDLGLDVTIALDKLNHCDPSYQPTKRSSDEEIERKQEEAIAKAREDYLKSLPESTQPKAKKKRAKPKPSLPMGIRVGDNVRNLDNGVVGTVTHLCDRCINIQNAKQCESHNLEMGTPRLEILEKPCEAVVFAIGDRVTYASEIDSCGRYGMGATVLEKRFDKAKGITWMKIKFDDGYIWNHAVEGSGTFKFLENPNKLDSLPEITPDLHGYFEHYQPVIKGAKSYWYRRYVYVDISGKLVHHHVPNKMVESIETLWRSGATAKEICLALGKNLRH
ncbi:hypothetical protein [Pseudanabaena sp. 'Roaring Creek']|uniref:hypothetical protein n=1 Tax=Pseudanabaena sp. 'Roaring Creek' TaxID=1681830 RepID=UPI0006D7B128|nr:hypothetical protein [Pseudanabaena sp. 'Roaring Creek']